MAGTGYYMSPGVIKGEYGKACDIWSLGIVMYYMLCHEYPFKGKTLSRVFESAKRGVYRDPDNVSDDCKNFLKRLLDTSESNRITAEQAL